MKFSILIDHRGAVVGASRAVAAEKGAKTKSDITAEMVAGPGQSIHEAEVPDDFSQLDGPQLLQRLHEAEPVRKLLRNLPTAGQAM